MDEPINTIPFLLKYRFHLILFWHVFSYSKMKGGVELQERQRPQKKGARDGNRKEVVVQRLSDQ